MRLVHKYKGIKRSKIVVISGPSAGVGKDTVVRMFLAKHPDWQNPISTTTRRPRPGEVNGVDMTFVDIDTFINWKSAGKFVETAKVNGNFYGILKQPIEEALNVRKNIILRVNIDGALYLKSLYPRAILIFMVAQSDKDLEERLRKRATEKETEIKQRLTLAKQEARQGFKFDHTVISPSGHPERVVAAIEKILEI